jgi:hypothetical protein
MADKPALLDPGGRTATHRQLLGEQEGLDRGGESPRPSNVRVLILGGAPRFMACVVPYGLKSAPMASTGERRHLAMRHERQGAFDS